MKKFLLAIFSFLFFFGILGTASAVLPDADQEAILNQIEIIRRAVNQANSTAILEVVSPNATDEFRQEIRLGVDGKYVRFQQSIDDLKELAPGKVKAKGQFVASGINWSINGLSNYYIFEKNGEEWLLLDSEFQNKLNSKFVFKKVIFIAVPAFFIFLGFWVWMLVDAVRRDFDGKTKWILLIIFLGYLGAVLYYFLVFRKYRKLNRQRH